MIRFLENEWAARVAIAVICFAVGASIVTVGLWPEPPYPIKLHKANIVETCVEGNVIIARCMSGDRLRINYKVEWTEKCPTYVDIYVFKDLEGVPDEIVYRNGPLLTAFDEGTHEWIRDVVIPPHLKDGTYLYRARLTGKCRDKEWPLAVPDMFFQIKR